MSSSGSHKKNELTLLDVNSEKDSDNWDKQVCSDNDMDWVGEDDKTIENVPVLPCMNIIESTS